MMPLHERIAAQLRRPVGLFGRLVMAPMLNFGNAELIAATLHELQLGPSDTYLDVGFGGGGSLRQAARALGEGHIYGVDASADMVTRAQRKFRPLIHAGRLSLIVAPVEDLPLRDGLVDKVSTINTIYFWSDPKGALRSLRRVLRKGGRLAIAFTGAQKMASYGRVTKHGFTWYRPEDVVSLLKDAGFASIEVQPQSGRKTAGDFVVAAGK